MSQYLHERSDFKDLLRATAAYEKINDPSLVEKDYWIMHCLYALKKTGLRFELKGGTSLSKGFGIIDRFSEDIDLWIEPQDSLTGFKVYKRKNQDDDQHRDSRKEYFDWLTGYLAQNISGLIDVTRDTNFDDTLKFRNGGIRLNYATKFPVVEGLKSGILLEVGFDTTSPNQARTISSWASAHASRSNVAFKVNDAIDIPCYEPKYTFVEKLQAVVKKFRQFKEAKPGAPLPSNFLRHYYDLSQLIVRDDVKAFIGTAEYNAHKKLRFGRDDNKVSNSDAFKLSDPKDRELFEKQYIATKSLYFRGQPSLQSILDRIGEHLDRL